MDETSSGMNDIGSNNAGSNQERTSSPQVELAALRRKQYSTEDLSDTERQRLLELSQNESSPSLETASSQPLTKSEFIELRGLDKQQSGSGTFDVKRFEELHERRKKFGVPTEWVETYQSALESDKDS